MHNLLNRNVIMAQVLNDQIDQNKAKYKKLNFSHLINI